MVLHDVITGLKTLVYFIYTVLVQRVSSDGNFYTKFSEKWIFTIPNTTFLKIDNYV